MNTFESLLFVPEGSLFNEKLALKNALKQTLRHYKIEFGSIEREKYRQLSLKFKFLSEEKQISTLLKNFLPEEKAAKLFNLELSKQFNVIKDSNNFLNKINGQVKLICYSRFNDKITLPRLKAAKIEKKFDNLFFKNDFQNKALNQNILNQIVSTTKSDPSTLLVVGTNLTEEIKAAQDANIKSLWLAPKKDKIPISPHPTLHLSKLTDLLFYLNEN